MNRYLLLYAVLVTATSVYAWRHYRTENQRLTQNQTALSLTASHYRTEAGRAAASVQILRLRCAEFAELRAEDAAQLRTLGIKLRRVEAMAKNATSTHLELRTPLRDTIIIRQRDTILRRDTIRLFRWRDAWTRVEGLIDGDSVVCSIHSVDTLRQIVHRIPRRFLFIKWGTKALRQEVISTNPHTNIIHTEYIRIER